LTLLISAFIIILRDGYENRMMKQFRILLVDDEQRILNFLSAKLITAGYDILTANDGYEALEQAQAQEPDLIVLDVLMPRMNGFEMLKELRTFSSVPVIFLSARGTDADRIKGLSTGADDYLPKPFNPDELLARIEAIRRRLKPSEDKTAVSVTFGELAIDFSRHCVGINGKEIRLTRIEWLLLSELAHNAGRLMTYGELLTRVWGPEYRDDVQILRTWISRLRSKVENDPDKPALIRTMPKAGYILEQPPAR
jgi:DNA-binding response OmpR family regulator